MTSNAVSNAGNAGDASQRRVLVSLRFLPADAPALKEQLTAALEAHLPLSDLHWKSSSRGTIRVIDSLNLELRDYRDVLAGSSSAGTGFAPSATSLPQLNAGNNLLERPYLHILFVGTDVGLLHSVYVERQC